MSTNAEIVKAILEGKRQGNYKIILKNGQVVEDGIDYRYPPGRPGTTLNIATSHSGYVNASSKNLGLANQVNSAAAILNAAIKTGEFQ